MGPPAVPFADCGMQGKVDASRHVLRFDASVGANGAFIRAHRSSGTPDAEASLDAFDSPALQHSCAIACQQRTHLASVVRHDTCGVLDSEEAGLLAMACRELTEPGLHGQTHAIGDDIVVSSESAGAEGCLACIEQISNCKLGAGANVASLPSLASAQGRPTACCCDVDGMEVQRVSITDHDTARTLLETLCMLGEV